MKELFCFVGSNVFGCSEGGFVRELFDEGPELEFIEWLVCFVLLRDMPFAMVLSFGLGELFVCFVEVYADDVPCLLWCIVFLLGDCKQFVLGLFDAFVQLLQVKLDR